MGRIIVSSLGKAYKQYPGRWSRLVEWVFGGLRVRHSLKWVLKDISFSVEPGEAVGIIGINGAGKSTLLKLITGTTQPSCGAVQIHGSPECDHGRAVAGHQHLGAGPIAA